MTNIDFYIAQNYVETEQAENFIRIDKEDKAIDILSQAINKANEISDLDISDKGFTLSIIADRYADLGEYDIALEIIDTIESTHMSPGLSKASSLTYIAEKYADEGRTIDSSRMLSYALDVLDSIKSGSVYRKDSALESIAYAYAKINEYDKARKVAALMQNISFHLIFDLDIPGDEITVVHRA